VTGFGRSASPRDDTIGKARFRVVERTGNCCENYITINSKGELFDLGGKYINFTRDDGKTWKQVRTINPLVNGEGAIAIAPGGDVVAIEWDPYSGDHLLSYKYDGKTKTWQYLEAPLHTPFYDRPWLSVIPGPFSIDGEKVPYVVMVDGYPHFGTFLYSTDGLTYTQLSSANMNEGPPVKGLIRTARERDLDWIGPNSNSPITPLGGGYALANLQPWALFDPETQQWSQFDFPQPLSGRVLVDSKGRVHNLRSAGDGLEYRLSPNGGKTWKTATMKLPQGATPTEIDFRVNAAVGVAAVGLHVDGGDSDRDLLYKLDITTNKPRVTKLYEIGLGDIDSTAGVGQDIRFDFETLAIFPDGRLAISFLDSTTGPVFHLQEPIAERIGPALAIEL
jgi:hypothetical protein